MSNIRSPFAAGKSRRVFAPLVVLTLMAVLGPSGRAQAEDRKNMTVLDGDDNVEASVAWSKQSFPNTATDAVIGRDDSFADNLAAGLLQGVLDAPLLLTSSNSLDGDVRAELARLGVRTVHVLGGTKAISSAVESSLRSEGYTVRRYSGASRVETAIAIAEAHAPSATNAIVSRAFGSASGDETSAWADALAAGAWAAADGMPILFSQTDTLTLATRAYLQRSSIRKVFALGGTSAISAAVADQIRALGITVERIAGSNRFATAVEVAKERRFGTAAAAAHIVLVEGQAANAWAPGFASAYFASNPKPVLLANGSSLPPETDAWFAGGASSKQLTVAPFVSQAAASAAANKLGLLKTAKITLDAESFANSGNITGKATPMDDVTSVSVSGPCVTSGLVSPNTTTGVFSIPISQTFQPGACALTFTTTYKDSSTATTNFTVTITGPAPNATVTDAPELVNATVSAETSTHVLLKFAFDEAVTLDSGALRLVAFDSTLLTPQAPANPAVRPDPGDTTAVLASFKMEDYRRSTTAVALAGAVKGTTGQVANPEGSRPLQAVDFEAGRTVKPDLVSVGGVQTVNRGTTASPEWVVRATFTFDIAATTVTIANYKLMTSTGDWHPGINLFSGDESTTHVVEFGTNAGAIFGTDAAAETAANTFRDAVRRAWIDSVGSGAVKDAWGQVNMSQTVVVGSSAVTVPNLTGITLLSATNEARFQFAGTVAAPDSTKFFLYDHLGSKIQGIVAPAAVLECTNTCVKVTFADGAIDGQVTGGGTDSVAVTDAEFQTLPASGHGHTYGAGTTLAPDLQAAIRAPIGEDPFGGGAATSYKVTFRFDVAVTGLAVAKLKMYAADGTPTVFGGFGGGDGCLVGTTPTTKTDVVCTVSGDTATLRDAIKNAVLFAVETDAADADGPDKTYSNYPTSKVPTSA